MGVRLRNSDSGAVTELACEGVFPFIGTVPSTEFLVGAVALNGAGHVVTDGALGTSLAGIFAVGAVRQDFSGELVSAAGEGASAIKSIAAFLA
jgi:thioredoxin reductase (NADPH)